MSFCRPQSREDSWVQGSLGFEDVDCDYINHTYVKAQSQELDALLKQEVAAFHTDVKGVKSGQVRFFTSASMMAEIQVSL